MRRSGVQQKRGQGGSSMNRTSGSLLDDSDDDQNELQAYLSSLSKKKAPARSPNISDISVSSGDISLKGATKQQSTSKFLKKKNGSQNVSETNSGKLNLSSSQYIGGSMRDSREFGSGSGLSALDKVAALSNKYGKKAAGTKAPSRPLLSDSDMEMDISLDDDSMEGGSVQNKAKPLNEKNSQQGPSQLGTSNKFLKKNKQKMTENTEDKDGKENKKTKSSVINERNSYLGQSSLTKMKSVERLDDVNDSDSNSLDIGKSSGKFLKKKPQGSSPGITIPRAQVENDSSSSESDTAELMKGIEGISDISVIEEDNQHLTKTNTTAKYPKKNRGVHFEISDASKSETIEPQKTQKSTTKSIKTSTPSKSGQKAIVFDSDEEELQEFIEGLSPTPTPDSALKHKENDTEDISDRVESSIRSRSASSISTEDEGPAFNLVTLDDILGDDDQATAASSSKPKKNDKKSSPVESATDKRPVPKPRKSKMDSESVGSPEPESLRRMQTLDDVLDLGKDEEDYISFTHKEKGKHHGQKADESTSSSQSEDIVLDMSPHSDIVNESHFDADKKRRPTPTPRSEAFTPKSEIISEIQSEIQYQSDFEKTQSRVSPTPTPRSHGTRYSDDFEKSQHDRTDTGSSRSASPKRSRSDSRSRPDSRSSNHSSVSRSRSYSSLTRTSSRRSSYSRSRSRSPPSKSDTSSRLYKKRDRSPRMHRKASHSAKRSDRLKRKDSFSSSSSRASKDDSYSESDRSRKSRRDHKGGRQRTVKVQTDHAITALQYQWNSHTMGTAVEATGQGMQHVDPTPIATHAVSAETLEVMTGYSPSVLVLNDMLRQQLQLTKSFLGIQQRIYHSLMGSDRVQYRYTTLEDTKKYIRKHRKPKLTFDQALKLVKAEMGYETK